MSSSGSFYIATPIFYVNDVPHIGHAYTEVAADVLARWHRQAGDDTWLLTGTDEHGQKILRTAIANGVEPQQWADQLVESAWKPLLDTIDIANDDFIRTTEPRHEKAVAIFLQKLYDDGFIYSGEYEGYYCVGCEEYKQLDDLELTEVGDYAGQLVCKIHSRPVEILKEKNYFFRMSQFEQQLLDLYDAQPDFVQPESVRNEIIQFVKQGLADLSISRSSFDWGIKVPWDDTHVVYVWFDALLNYITAIGYGVDDEQFERRWPAVHLVGKDIARFHAVIWPAMLMAAGPAGAGQGLRPRLAAGRRREDVEVEAHRHRAAADHRHLRLGRVPLLLPARDLVRPGRLVQLGGPVGPLPGRARQRLRQPRLARRRDGVALLRRPRARRRASTRRPTSPSSGSSPGAADAADAAIERLAIHEAIAAIWTIVDELNGYITEQEPWVLAKDPANAERLSTVLYTASEGLRALAVLLSPVMPKATTKLWTALGAEANLGPITAQPIRTAGDWGMLPPGSTIAPLEPLFPRIEADADVDVVASERVDSGAA